MAFFMFHFGYAVRSEIYVVPPPAFVVAGYVYAKNYYKKVVYASFCKLE